jgi:hypothetical protein
MNHLQGIKQLVEGVHYDGQAWRRHIWLVAADQWLASCMQLAVQHT